MNGHPGLWPVAPLPPPGGGRRESEAASIAAHRWDGVIAGMVEKGLGLEAIAAILEMSPEEVVDRTDALSLPTPRDGPMRRNSHPRAWAIPDMRLMIDCWLDRWDADSMAALFWRSRSGIYGLKRRLNLPARDRGEIRRPGAEGFARRQRQRGATGRQASPLPPPQTQRSDMPRPSRRDGKIGDPRIVLVASPPPPILALRRSLMGAPLQLAPVPLAPPSAGAVTIGLVNQPDGSVLRVQRRAARKEIQWTPEIDLNLAYRVFAKQHYKGIAADLGLSPAAIRSRMTRLGLPTAPRPEQMRHFDPSAIIENIVASGCVLKRCNFLPEFYFWSGRGEAQHRSPCAIKSRSYKKAQAAIESSLGF